MRDILLILNNILIILLLMIINILGQVSAVDDEAIVVNVDVLDRFDVQDSAVAVLLFLIR